MLSQLYKNYTGSDEISQDKCEISKLCCRYQVMWSKRANHGNLYILIKRGQSRIDSSDRMACIHLIQRSTGTGIP